MAISRKPKAQPMASKVDVEALINKGGSVAQNPTKDDKETISPVILRVPTDILNRVDELLGGRRIKTPRHTWMLEAIIEKLDKESGT